MPTKIQNKQFNFGENWENFSKNQLSSTKIQEAKKDFVKFFQNESIKNQTFIDIGFGQGMSLLIANTLGAITVGNDINPLSEKVLEFNKSYFSDIKEISIPIIIGSILKESTLNAIRQINEQYDIVHSWGVLHHTGEMWEAINNSSELVNKNGKFIIAIYNKHWSSPLWHTIKKTYNYSPKFIKKLIISIFYFIILIAKFSVTFKNPFKKERGMSFYYDVIDWVGGYPYEYANKEEIQTYIENLGFQLIYYNKAQVPTGCNEYVFKKL